MTKYYSSMQATSFYQSAYYDDVLLDQFEKHFQNSGKQLFSCTSLAATENMKNVIHPHSHIFMMRPPTEAGTVRHYQPLTAAFAFTDHHLLLQII